MEYDMDPFDDEEVPCPACGCLETLEISDADKIRAAGLYDIYDFIGMIDSLVNNYYCPECGYVWFHSRWQ
jgi:predicted RNA-binding Zn-ribbon protein involved in translation (DUF1610 family)